MELFGTYDVVIVGAEHLGCCGYCSAEGASTILIELFGALVVR